jgi:predicted SnoaL-like aldol condensation-catalyzing enzyme
VSERFIDQFREGWDRPKPDGFLAYFRPLIRDDAVQRANPTPPVTGPDGQAAFFRRFFRLIPDARMTVVSAAVDGEWVFIRTRIDGHVGGRAVSFEGVDHFRIVDGLIAERDTFTDAKPLFAAIGLAPRSWVAAARFLIGR